MEVAEKTRFIYEFGKFRLDPEGKTLFADGEALHIPAKEFETLLFLVEHNGRAISKTEMMTAIWQDAFVEEGNLAKQISRLRKILNTNGEQFIETIPKHGYRFSADLRRIEPIFEPPLVVQKHTVKRLTVAYDDETPVKALPPAGGSSRVWRYISLLLVAAALVGGTWIWFHKNANLSTAKINTIAVLPLRPLGGDEDGKALGLGLTDALITKLGMLKRVVVRPTNAVAAFAANVDPAEFGRKQNVDAVLEGTIQQAQGRLRVNARLLRTSTGEQIWADQFEQPTGGIFALQDALSANIAKALAFELSKSDAEELKHRGTESAEAYEKYLRGRFYQSQNSPDGLKKSIELYQQAAALDPNFAEAYAGIADSNVILFNFGLLPADQTIPNARQAVDRAMRLDPSLSNAYTSSALIQFLIDHNWPVAEKSLQKAIDLNPNNADAFLRYGYFLINVGRFDEALEKLQKARELNPLSAIVNTNIGLGYLAARRYPEAIQQLEKVSAENPKFSLPYWLLGAAFEASDDAEKAFQANMKALDAEGEIDGFGQKLQQYKDAHGIEAANRFWLDETIAARKEGKASSLIAASRAAAVKDREQTLYWIERSVEEGDPAISQIKYLERFDFVRDDPRFQAVLDKITY